MNIEHEIKTLLAEEEKISALKTQSNLRFRKLRSDARFSFGKAMEDYRTYHNISRLQMARELSVTVSILNTLERPETAQTSYGAKAYEKYARAYKKVVERLRTEALELEDDESEF